MGSRWTSNLPHSARSITPGTGRLPGGSWIHARGNWLSGAWRVGRGTMGLAPGLGPDRTGFFQRCPLHSLTMATFQRLLVFITEHPYTTLHLPVLSRLRV